MILACLGRFFNIPFYGDIIALMKRAKTFYFLGQLLVIISVLVSLACLITVVSKAPGSFEIVPGGETSLSDDLIPIACLAITILVLYLSIGALVIKVRKIEILKYLFATFGIIFNVYIVYFPVQLLYWLSPSWYDSMSMASFYYLVTFSLYFWLLLSSFVSVIFLKKMQTSLS